MISIEQYYKYRINRLGALYFINKYENSGTSHINVKFHMPENKCYIINSRKTEE